MAGPTRRPRARNPHQEKTAAANARAAYEEECRRCGGPILRGLDGDVLAFTARADPERLSAAGELLARAEGRATYRVRSGTGRPELSVRDSWQIAGEPARLGRGLLGVHVVAEHRCGS